MVTHVCRSCGSDRIVRLAKAGWSDSQQSWVMGDMVPETDHCEACGKHRVDEAIALDPETTLITENGLAIYPGMLDRIPEDYMCPQCGGADLEVGISMVFHERWGDSSLDDDFRPPFRSEDDPWLQVIRVTCGSCNWIFRLTPELYQTLAERHRSHPHGQ